MFNIMGWTPPVYVHTSTLDKIDADTGKQRKLSKRHDPEASVANFLEQGYPTDAVLEYLLNIASSGFEEEKLKNIEINLWNYPIKIKKIPMSGALFDMKKLEWWSREYIGKMDIESLTNSVLNWANDFDKEWLEKLSVNKQYLESILSIERDDPKRIRKDFITWQQTMEEIGYFFDKEGICGSGKFVPNTEYEFNKNVLVKFLESFSILDSKDAWWAKIVQIANESGIKNGDVAMNLRVAITGRTNAPDLYSVMQVMGEERVRERINKTITKE
jgi:glutamyl-tRNA synthetase